jgi:hypothetical protein
MPPAQYPAGALAGAGYDAEGWAIMLDGKDLRGSWNEDGGPVLFWATTYWTERREAVVLGPITVSQGSQSTSFATRCRPS